VTVLVYQPHHTNCLVESTRVDAHNAIWTQ